MRHPIATAIGLGAAISVAGWTAPGAAQSPVCGPRDGLVGSLKQQFSEERAAVAVSSSGELVEIMASPEGTWTLLVTLPRGQTCVVAEGYGWQPTHGEQEQLTGSQTSVRYLPR